MGGRLHPTHRLLRGPGGVRLGQHRGPLGQLLDGGKRRRGLLSSGPWVLRPGQQGGDKKVIKLEVAL